MGPGLDREEKLMALGSRNFFLCNKRTALDGGVTTSCSTQAEKDSKTGFAWLKFMDFLLWLIVFLADYKPCSICLFKLLVWKNRRSEIVVMCVRFWGIFMVFPTFLFAVPCIIIINDLELVQLKLWPIVFFFIPQLLWPICSLWILFYFIF